jgi:predicted outer membrane lipoprotein
MVGTINALFLEHDEHEKSSPDSLFFNKRR